jgi:TatD DNase family protein
MFIDCHAHLDIPYATKTAIQEIIEGSKEKQVDHIVGVIGDPESYSHYQIQREFKNIIHVIGVQRGQALKEHSALISLLRNEIEANRPHAIGEIGLEYENLKNSTIRKKQQTLFKKQIQLAHEYNLPIVVHAGYSTDKDLVTILRGERASDLGGQIHCCRNGLEAIKEILEMDFFLSFGYPHIKEEHLIPSVLNTPIEQMLTETDSPYGLIGDPPRAKLLPADVVKITRKLAVMKEIEIKEFANQILQNARRLFKF